MLNDLIAQFATLAGVAALIAALINVAKAFGLPSESAPKVSAGLSLVAFAGLVALQLFAPEVEVETLDAQAQDLSVAVLYILGFLVQMGLPAQFHSFFKRANVPLIGTHEKG